MTETEWLSCTDPQPMLEWLRGKASERKLRLFAAACFWHVFPFLKEPEQSLKAIEFCERYADGLATKSDLHGHAWGKGGDANPVNWREGDSYGPQFASQIAGFMEADDFARPNRGSYQQWETSYRAAWDDLSLSEAMAHADTLMPSEWIERRNSLAGKEREAQSRLLFELIGNPVRTVELDSRWRTSRVSDTARTVYKQKAWHLMPILADALIDAGCDDETILDHCRTESEHYRGCWVVDLVLGKSCATTENCGRDCHDAMCNNSWR